MTADALYDRAEALIEAGDENALTKFVFDHLAEFPEEDRDEFMLAFFGGALDEAGKEDIARHEFIEGALETLVVLDNTRRIMEDAVAEDKVRERLSHHRH